jgi:alanyl-tRNA synthetase
LNTERLYYKDAYLRGFDATVTSAGRDGEARWVTLDRTAFYPTSGGQPFDTGTLGGFRIVDVVDRDDGSIAHVVESRTVNREPGTGNLEPGTGNLEPGTSLHGEIDWRRRFDHMQQHTGQHVLSAAFDRLYKVATVSFHLGAESSTIDLARTVTADEIAKAEDEANRIVWEDRPVHIRFADAEEAAALKLRKPSAREGTLRLIDVEDFDLSACGGTHVARTGAIGVIAVASSERFKGGQRLEFVCGGRALARFRSLRDAVAASVRSLSVMPAELPAAIEKLHADTRQQKRAITALQNELAAFRAEELAAGAEMLGALRVVARAVDGDANGLKSLAAAVADQGGHVAVLVSTTRPALVAIARASDVPVNAQQLLASLIQRFGGRGGGKAELAQGGGLDVSSDQILAASRELLIASTTNS